jgi:hypothetical protein
MIKNGVTLSIRECEVLLELIGSKSLAELKKLKPEALDVISDLTSIVRDNQLADHVEQYH